MRRLYAESVRRDGIDASELASAVERRLDTQHLVAVVRDDVALRLRLGSVQPFPTAQVGEQSRRELHGRLALRCGGLAVRVAMKDAVHGVDKRESRPANP